MIVIQLFMMVVEGMRFIETVLESNNNNSKWIQFNFK